MTSKVKDSPRTFSYGRIAAAFVAAAAAGVGGYAWSSMEAAPEPDRVIRIDGMVSNLSGGAMVKLSVSLLVAPGEGRDDVEDRTRDFMIGHLRGLGRADLDGVEGIERLKSSLLGGARETAGDGVKEVLIREFVVNG